MISISVHFNSNKIPFNPFWFPLAHIPLLQPWFLRFSLYVSPVHSGPHSAPHTAQLTHLQKSLNFISILTISIAHVRVSFPFFFLLFDLIIKFALSSILNIFFEFLFCILFSLLQVRGRNYSFFGSLMSLTFTLLLTSRVIACETEEKVVWNLASYFIIFFILLVLVLLSRFGFAAWVIQESGFSVLRADSIGQSGEKGMFIAAHFSFLGFNFVSLGEN